MIKILVSWDLKKLFNCYIQNIRYIHNIQGGKLLEPTPSLSFNCYIQNIHYIRNIQGV